MKEGIMRLSFSNRIIPTQSLKKNRKIQAAISAYRGKRVPMRVLLTNFLAVKSKGDELAEAENPWAYYYKGMQGHEVESGVSIDETLFRFATMEIKEQKPTDLINAAFYSNKTRNDSDFEIGYLLPEFLEICSGDLLIINPSPDIVCEIEARKNDIGRVYAVADDTVSKLYEIQFPKATFITFEQIDRIHDIRTVLIINRDQKVDMAIGFLNSIKCCVKEATIVALVPAAWFDNPHSGAYNTLKENRMSIKQMLVVDPKATASSPRKKVMVLIESEEEEDSTIEVKQSEIDLETRLFKVLEATVIVDAHAYLSSQKTIHSCIRDYYNPPVESRPLTKKAKEYVFSKEISLFYRIYGGRKNRYGGVAYYREIQQTNPVVWGRVKTANIERGLRAESAEEVVASLEKVPFYEEIYPIIRTDIHRMYAGNNKSLSLKTIWFYCWTELKEQRKYDHEYLSAMMRNSDIADYMTMLQTGEGILSAIAAGEKVSIGDIPYRAIEQFNMIFAVAVKHKMIAYNPLETYVSEYSKRATERQQDVRNALVKKHFSDDEERAVFSSLTKRVEIKGVKVRRCIGNSLLLATIIRLFTGMAVREVTALTWSDYQYVKETGCYQITITKFVNPKGQIVSHSEKDNWKRFRVVPVTAVVAALLNARKKHLLNLGIEESYLEGMPIVIREEWIPQIKKLKPIRHVKPSIISSSERKLIKNIGIPENNLVLPDDINELSTDFNRYHGDIFLSNFRHKANHEAYLTMGEINYMIGIMAPDTFSRYYCDYTNVFMQEAIAQKLRRWGWRYEKMLKNTKRFKPSCGEEEGAFSLEIGPFVGGNAAVDMIIENTSDSKVEITAECVHGMDVKTTEY